MSIAAMSRFARTRETPDWARTGTLLEQGGDFGFGWSGTFGGGLLGGLPPSARAIVGGIWGQIRGRPSTVVISPTIPTIPRPATPAPEEGEVVAHDWGHLGRELLGGIAQQAFGTPAPAAFAPFVGGQMGGAVVAPAAGASVMEVLVGDTMSNACGLDGQVWGGQAPPKGYKVVNFCGNPVLRRIRRRRRRRILSASDAQDIATIVGLVGKGQMASALINRRP